MSNMFLNVRFKTSANRTAADGGEFTTYYYHILPSTPAAAIEQYLADQKDAGYDVIKDAETGMYIYRNYRMVPKGCAVKRSLKGKWYADTTKLRELAEIAKCQNWVHETDEYYDEEDKKEKKNTSPLIS